MNQAQVSYQMNENSKAFLRILGKVPTFMRPPYGRYNTTVQATLASLGFVIVTWNADSGDTWGITLAEEVWLTR